MFPASHRPELTNEQLSGKSTKDGDDFFTKHGGKVAFVGISVTVYLVYSFFKGGQLRTAEEEKVAETMMVEPHEINELRLMNGQLDPPLFEKMILDSFSHFRRQLKSSEVNSEEEKEIMISYDVFIKYATRYLRTDIKHGHILDRIAFSQPDAVRIESKQSINAKPSGDGRSVSSALFLPLHRHLVLLSTSVPAPALERAHQLFTVAACLHALQQAEKGSLQRSEGPVEIEEVPWTVAEVLLQDLALTSQVPNEKLVCETGVKYPWRTYRRKIPSDMVQAFKTARKIDSQVQIHI